MKFVKLSGQHHWYEWDEVKFRLYNFRGGWMSIDENSDEWMYSTIVELDSWHDLYMQMGYDPTLSLRIENDHWLAPDGRLHCGDGHELCAEMICELLYGEQDNFITFYAADHLVENGWVKLTTYAMLPFYVESGMYRHLTSEQKDTISLWCHANNIDEERIFGYGH